LALFSDTQSAAETMHNEVNTPDKRPQNKVFTVIYNYISVSKKTSSHIHDTININPNAYAFSRATGTRIVHSRQSN